MGGTVFDFGNVVNLEESGKALFELIVQASVTVIFLYLLRKRIRRWWNRLIEGTHSRMLGVVDLTQTIVEDGFLKVRTGRPTTIAEFTLRDEPLTAIFTEAVERSYAQKQIFVTIPQTETVAFKKLKTLIFSHANTAFAQEAAWEYLKPLSSRVETVKVSGKLVVYTEDAAEVSKVHVEFIPDSLWTRLDTLEEARVRGELHPEWGAASLMERLKSLRKLRDEFERPKPEENGPHLLAWNYVSELIDYRATIEAGQGE